MCELTSQKKHQIKQRRKTTKWLRGDILPLE